MIRFEIVDWEHPDTREIAKLVSNYTNHAGVIAVRFVTSEDIRELNRVYAGKDESTDVLSFSYIESETGYPEGGPDFSVAELGDIAISRTHVHEQASAAGTDEDTERLLLITHGTLHVLGFDHGTKAEQHRMDGIQHDIMRQLGRTYRNFGWQD